MKNYRTKTGDLWDLIAFQQLGSCRHMEKLINANRDKITTFMFKAGTQLTLPEINTTTTTKLPPWRR